MKHNGSKYAYYDLWTFGPLCHAIFLLELNDYACLVGCETFACLTLFDSCGKKYIDTEIFILYKTFVFCIFR